MEDRKTAASKEPRDSAAMPSHDKTSGSETSSRSSLELSPVGTQWSRSPPSSPPPSPIPPRPQPAWCGFSCFRRLNRRYWFVGLALLLLLSLIWSNPYQFRANTDMSPEEDYFAGSETYSPDDDGNNTYAGNTYSSSTSTDNMDISYVNKIPHPEPDPNSIFCTTWPVDKKTGAYKPAPRTSPRHRLTSHAPPGGWKKPDGIRVVAMIFYGRRRSVDILDCYLRSNLASENGAGHLDEVWFMVHTTVEDDVLWLRELVGEVPQYKFVDLGPCASQPYGCIWEYAVEDDTIYIKIDDDIMFIHPDAIPQLVHTRIAQPHPYAISAQLVNSPVTGLQALHYGALHPFLPDPASRPPSPAAPNRPPAWPETWKPSANGLYPSSSSSSSSSTAAGPAKGAGPGGNSAAATRPLDVRPSYRGHHWLLLTDDAAAAGKEMLRTPVGDWNANPGPADVAFGPGWTSWGVAAQQEYSLLYNIETDRMDRYFYGRAIDYGGGGNGGAGVMNMRRRRSGKGEGEEREKKRNIDGRADTGGEYGFRGSEEEGESASIGIITTDEDPRVNNNNNNDSSDHDNTAAPQPPSPTTPGVESLLYDMCYQRYNLNFVAIWGRDVRDNLPIGDDEPEITASIPRRLGRPFVIDTRAVVAHHAFFTQADGVRSTDLLDRWRALANELVCEEQGNVKVPWDGRCEGF